MHNFMQLGVRDAEFPAPNRRRASDGGVFERITKSVSTNHSSRAHDYQALLTCARNIHCTAPIATKALVEPSWLLAVMIMRVPPASPRTVDAPQTTTRHPSSQTCRGSGAKPTSCVAFHRQS